MRPSTAYQQGSSYANGVFGTKVAMPAFDPKRRFTRQELEALAFPPRSAYQKRVEAWGGGSGGVWDQGYADRIRPMYKFMEDPRSVELRPITKPQDWHKVVQSRSYLPPKPKL